MSYKDILDIVDPFDKTSTNIILSIPSPIKVFTDPFNIDSLLESIKARPITPLHGISIPTLDALVAEINKLFQFANIAPKTKLDIEKLIEVVPHIHVGFTFCLGVITIVAYIAKGKQSKFTSTESPLVLKKTKENQKDFGKGIAL